MKFKAYYKDKPKEPIAPPPPPPAPAAVIAEPPRPVAPVRAGSIKIKTSASGTPRPSISTPSVASPAVNNVASAPRQPSFSQPKPPANTPPPTVKRPLPAGEEKPAAKRPKTDTPQPAENGQRRRSSIVTLKVSDKKRLSLALGGQSPSPKRTSLPGVALKKEKEPTPEGVPESVKSARKPLPSGDSSRKPLPGASPMSPPPAPPKMTIDTNAATASPATGPQTGRSATPGTPASGRPKIKIIRKPNPGSAPGSAQAP